jgi:Ser/Thr protein kinase RdoA (MazF antagonist)
MSHPAALFGFDPPELGVDAVLMIAAEHWEVSGTPRRLRGERSHNTLIAGPGGAAWTLQVQSASEDPAVIDLQTQAMRHLERRAPDVPTSRVVPTVTGEVHAEVEVAGRRHLARLVTFLPGTTFDATAPLPVEAYRRIGDLLARIAVGLADFEHPVAAHFMPWDLANGLIVDDTLRSDLTASSIAALDSIDDRLHAVVATMRSLPRRTIHNDGHAGNLVRRDATSHEVSGVIDFGDLVHTVTAADVAIIAESFAPDHPDPASVVAAATAGYHAHVTLTDSEIEAVPDLVLARAALNVLLAEHQIRHAPHLAPGAAASLPDVVERLVRWSRLDAGAMIARVHEAIAASPEPAEAAP